MFLKYKVDIPVVPGKLVRKKPWRAHLYRDMNTTVFTIRLSSTHIQNGHLLDAWIRKIRPG